MQFSPFDLTDLQRNAWIYEISYLKQILQNQSGQILFEYSIPRLGKRVDVVLLIKGVIFVLEFKVGAEKYLRQDIEQVWDYALDLKNFHEESRAAVIVPVLIATETKGNFTALLFSHYNDMVVEPLLCNADNLPFVLDNALSKYASSLDLSDWSRSRYMPTPTIIQTASSLYLNHSVEDITRSEASGESLKKTTDVVTGNYRYYQG